MPTARPRFQVTETPEIQRALQVAAEAWPEASRADLVLRLFQAGAEAIGAGRSDERERRRRLVDAAAGTLDAAYEPKYLERLREDWPE